MTCTRTYRSPAGPPRSPGAPLPLSLIRWPSATPAGMRAWMVRVLIARPLPEHTGHGSSTTSPRPRHSWHGSENAKLPRFLLSWPVPSQFGQTRGTVPGLGPGALAGRARALAGQPQADRDAVQRVAERQRGLRLHVRAAPRPVLRGTRPAAAAEHAAQDVPEPAARAAAAGRAAAEQVAEVEAAEPAARRRPGHPGPAPRNPPPNSERASSYSLRRLLSDSVL